MKFYKIKSLMQLQLTTTSQASGKSILNCLVFHPVEFLVPFFKTDIFFPPGVFEENLQMAVLVHILLRMPDYHYELFQKKGSLELECLRFGTPFFYFLLFQLSKD